ncbi:MAG: hypothetical protein MUF64_01745 [Polyangiaceae bacterium]|jgi:hypothetical protein|nr:hypothetical protein [Polyangiaceae bacterium]
MAGQMMFPFFQTRSGSRVRGKRISNLAPRLAPSALRVPHPSHTQVPLVFTNSLPQVFVHEGARQALERRLLAALKGPVSLHINDNVHSVITLRERGGQLRVGLHHMFLGAPGAIVDALVRYVVAASNSEEGRAASLLIGRYIHENHHRLRASRPPLHPLKTQGEHHDLLELFRRVNERYFEGSHDALVTWGRASRPRPAEGGKRPSRRIIKLGSYSTVERLIRVHPALDKGWVPRYFLEYILYHEMLHHVIPTSRVCGRAVLHPPEFRERERAFRAYDRALAWEREHIGRLLRA